MEKIDIRPYESKDKTGVLLLINSIFESEFSSDRNLYPLSDVEDVAKSYGGKRDIFYVMISDNKIIGTVAIKEDDRNVALLRRVFVDPCYRGMGYGTKLIKTAIEFCMDNSYCLMAFRATDKMISAIQLCKKNGFIERANLPMGDVQIFKFVLSLDNVKK